MIDIGKRRFLVQSAGVAASLALAGTAQGAAAPRSPGRWAGLEQRIAGALILPSNPLYDTARSVWNGAIDRRPAAILLCSRTEDVIEGVRFAAAEGLKVCVRGGGHNVAGRAVQDDALLLDLAALNGMQVNARERQVHAGGGALWRDLDQATARFGLATTGGMVADTGIGGLTLGGGIGWLMRRHGLTIDNLLSASVVLADGRMVEASATQNPDLFWALRGGGGRVGVVTRFTYRLHPVSTVLVAQLGCRVEHAIPFLRTVRDFNAVAPDELTTVLNASVMPAQALAPESLKGQPFIGVMACWCGETEAGLRILAPLRAALRAEADAVMPGTYLALQSGIAPRGKQTWWESRYLPTLDDAGIEWFAAQAQALPTPQSVLRCHQLGGAVSRGDPGDAAQDLRRNAYVVNAAGVSDHAADLNRLAEWARRSSQGFGALQANAYVNFSSSAGDPSQTHAGDIRARLEAIRRRYDPSALFV